MSDITEIKDGLWQGAYPKTGLPEHIKVVVNLCEELPPPTYQRYINAVLWCPTSDGRYKGLTWLLPIVDFVVSKLETKQDVLVHCIAGMSRSTLVVAAVLMRLNNWSADETLKFIRNRRPVIVPASCYEKALIEYEEYLKSIGRE